jgi:hypothetical protein
MYKTGTTSVGRALEKLGYKTFHGSSPFLDIPIDKFNWSSDEFAAYRPRVRSLANLYDAFEDFPFMWIYREMMDDFPDAKFVLTERDSTKVAQSDINMWKQLGRKNIPDASAFIDRYEKHHDAVLTYFGDSKQLLRIELGRGDEWTKLCDFLCLPIPTNVPFPRANKRPYGKVGEFLYRIARNVKDQFRDR